MKAVFITVLFLAGALLCRAQTPVTAPAERVSARIEGKTVNAIDNTPLRNVEIALMGNGEGLPQATKTDAEGHFSFPKITPGTYYVAITRTGFVTRRGSRAPLTNGGTITLAEGEKMVDVTIALSPSAVIRGKVLDPNGEPVAGARVSVLRPGRTMRMSRWNNIPPANTDDNGDFRLFGIPPGKYLVMATSAGLGAMEMAVASSAEAKESRTVPTYYPGVADPKQATPVTLKPGDELPLNLVLTTARTVHVRGSVTGKMGEKTMVVLVGTEEFFMGGQAEVKDGKFDIAGATPGRYLLQAVTMSEGDTQPRMGRQMVEVGASGADNVIVSLGGNARVSGSITVEDGKMDLKKIHIYLSPADSRDSMGGMAFSDGERDNGRVSADGSFQFKDIEPGRYHLAVAANSSGLEDWYTKSIRVGPQDVTYSAIEVPPDGTVSVQMVMSAAGGTIEGTAVDDKEKPWANVRVLAVPDSKRLQDDQSYGHATSDQHGHFKMRGLAPGEYTVLAFEDQEVGQDIHDPETLKSLEASGVKVRVEERSHKTVQAKVIPADDASQ